MGEFIPNPKGSSKNRNTYFVVTTLKWVSDGTTVVDPYLRLKYWGKVLVLCYVLGNKRREKR